MKVEVSTWIVSFDTIIKCDFHCKMKPLISARRRIISEVIKISYVSIKRLRLALTHLNNKYYFLQNQALYLKICRIFFLHFTDYYQLLNFLPEKFCVDHRIPINNWLLIYYKLGILRGGRPGGIIIHRNRVNFLPKFQKV